MSPPSFRFENRLFPRALRAFLLLAFAPLVLAGCGHFVPSPDRPAVTSDGIRARVVGLEKYFRYRHSPRSARVMLEIDEAPAGARLAAALLVPAGHLPCERGDPAEQIAVDGAYGEKELHSGSRVLLDFEGQWSRITGEPTRVDVVVDDGSHRRCVPLELTSAEPGHGWTYEAPVVGGIGQSFEGHTHAVSGSVWGTQVFILGGAWLGPLRLTAGPGIAIADCTFCPRSPKGERRDAVGLSMTVHGDVYPLQSGHFAFGLGARYSLVTMGQRRGSDETTLAAYHELGVAPLVAFAAPASWGMGVAGGPKMGTIALEFPIGLATPLDDYRCPALSIGAAWAIVF